MAAFIVGRVAPKPGGPLAVSSTGKSSGIGGTTGGNTSYIKGTSVLASKSGKGKSKSGSSKSSNGSSGTTSSSSSSSSSGSSSSGNNTGSGKVSSGKNTTASNSSATHWWQQLDGRPALPLIKLEEGAKWYDLYGPFEQRAKQEGARLEQSALKSLTAAVESAFHDEESAAGASGGPRGGGGDKKWLLDMISSGTLSDKIAALALLVQESPLHQLEALDLLTGMAAKKEQRTAQLALQAIKDLLVHNLLPDRKLRAFRAQPLGHTQLDMPTALLFWYEDQLMSRVQRVLDALDAGLKDTVEHFKKQCMETVAELLMSKPEQEGRLLAMLVNKLGDPTGNVCAKCIDLLRGVIRTHPAMKAVVVKEVKQLICRPGLPHRATYSAVVFLSQVPLHHQDHEVATLLVEIYVSLFENAIEIKEVGFRLLSALLTGINHAFPFLADTQPLAKHVDALFRIAHGDSFSAATQALMLISLIALSPEHGGKDKKKGKKGKDGEKKMGEMGAKPGEADGASGANAAAAAVAAPAERESGDLTNRFYRALYAKLLSEQVVTRGRNTLFLNLLFRSIKRDPSELRCMAFLKRLAMCATQSTPPIAAGLLFLISEVCRARKGMLAMMTEQEQVQMEEGDQGDEDDEQQLGSQVMGNFDASKREPAFAAVARPGLWEASLLRMHFHPSVKAFSSSLLDAPHEIHFAGDPTTEFSLSAFLNRFAYKNPKKGISDKIRRPQPTAEEPLNTNAFLSTAAATVDPEKRFFHKFFTEQSRLLREGRSHNRSRRTDKDGDEGEDDDAFDVDFDGEDGEREMDAFADKLASGMMRDFAANLEDPDMDDVDMEEYDMDYGAEGAGGGEDDDDDEEGGDDDDDDDDGDDFDEDGEGEGDDDEDDDEDYGGLMAYGDDEDDDDGEDGGPSAAPAKGKRKAAPALSGKAKKKTKQSGSGDFAEYSADFEKLMDERLAQVKNPMKGGKPGSKRR